MEDELINLPTIVTRDIKERLTLLAEEAGMLVGEYAGLLLAGEVRVKGGDSDEPLDDKTTEASTAKG